MLLGIKSVPNLDKNLHGELRENWSKFEYYVRKNPFLFLKSMCCAPAIMKPGLKMRKIFSWGTRIPEVKNFKPKLIIIVVIIY